MKVLHAEDEYPWQVKVKEVLAKLGGIELQLVGTGEEALALLQAEDFDALIIDNDMRGGRLTGVQTIGKIREELRLSIPIIMLAGWCNRAMEERLKELGVLFQNKDPDSFEEAISDFVIS